MLASVLDATVHKALTDKVVKYDSDHKRFECLYCEAKLSGEESAKDHLKSKPHREVGARHAIRNLETSPPSLVALLPDVARAAAETREICVVDSNEILCRICNIPSTGVVSLEDHLISKNHKKRKCVGNPQLIPDQCVPSPALLCMFKDPDVVQAVKEKTVVCDSPNDMQCVVCVSRFNGELSLKQHLNSTKHEEICAKLTIRDIESASSGQIAKLPEAVREAAIKKLVQVTDTKLLMCRICKITASGVNALNDHLLGSDHRKQAMSLLLSESVDPPDTNGASSNIPSRTEVDVDPPSNADSAIAKAKEDGIIDETDNVMEKFSCKCCNKKFNSDGPLVDHLKSAKHINKQKLFLESRSLSLPVPDHETEVSHLSSLPPTLKYSVISDVRGHVYIFNYSFQKTNKARKGAEHDSANLKDTFTRMGYEVFPHEDLTKEETNKCLEKIRRKAELNGIDSFIMFFLSHGVDEYTFLANDQEEMDLRIIRKKFTDRKCPYLKGKPKIFLVNYCRGDQLQKREIIEYDDIEVPNDMVTIHAATEGIMAKRTASLGTIFVASLCEVLKAHARDLDLRNIYNLLDEKMKERKGTKPMWEDYGFKTFYFNPADS